MFIEVNVKWPVSKLMVTIYPGYVKDPIKWLYPFILMFKLLSGWQKQDICMSYIGLSAQLYLIFVQISLIREFICLSNSLWVLCYNL